MTCEKRCEEEDKHQKAEDKKACHTGSYKVKLYKNCIKKQNKRTILKKHKEGQGD